MTAWNRLQLWHQAGVLNQVHEILLAELRHADKIDFSRFLIDSSHLRAMGAGEDTGPSPVDRSKPGSKHQVVTDGQGVPLVVQTTAANVPDVNRTAGLVDAVPPIAGKVGHPRKRPDRVTGDRGYDGEGEREELRRRGIDPELAKRRTPHGSHLGVYHWVIERTIDWLHGFRRLRIRWDLHSQLHEGLCTLAEVAVTFRFLELYGLT
jgi:hypothetical protein